MSYTYILRYIYITWVNKVTKKNVNVREVSVREEFDYHHEFINNYVGPCASYPSLGEILAGNICATTKN